MEVAGTFFGYKGFTDGVTQAFFSLSFLPTQENKTKALKTKQFTTIAKAITKTTIIKRI